MERLKTTLSEKQKIFKTEKPWGYELLWAHTNQYVGKILFVKANHSLSLQFHQKKEETIFLETGLLEVEYGETESSLKKMTLKPGESFHIPTKLIHRFKAIEDCRIFEVSTNFLEDVVRLKDSYGRV